MLQNFLNRFSYDKHFLNRWIVISFILLSFLSVIFLLGSGTIVGANDWLFHFQRLDGIARAWRNLNFFPQLNFYSMNQNGSAVFMFYPYITMFPIILFFCIFKLTIFSFYFCFIIIMFIGFLISFYSCKNYTNKVSTSYIFAFLYGTSNTLINSIYGSGDIPSFISILLIPLVIFGFMRYMKDGSWHRLCLGMILLIFTHILSTLIVTAFMIIWLLINFKNVIHDHHKIINLLKATGTTIAVTSVFTLPMLNTINSNVINNPYQFQLNGNDILKVLISPFSNDNTSVILGIAGLIGLIIIPLTVFKKLSKIDKQIYILGMITLLMTTNLIIPWNSINLESIKLIQFPYRLDVIPEFLFVYLFSKSLVDYFDFNEFNKLIKVNDVNSLKKLTIIVVLLLSIFCQFNSQLYYVNQGKSYTPLNTNYIDSDINYGQGYSNAITQSAYRIDNDKQFTHLINSPFSVLQTPDYYPQSSVSMNKLLSQKLGLYDVYKTIPFKLLGNGNYEFKNLNEYNIYELNLPVVTYSNFQYNVYLNGKFVPSYTNKTGLLTISNVKKGTYHLQIIVHNNNYFKLGLTISFISLLVIAFKIELDRERRLNNIYKKDVR